MALIRKNLFRHIFCSHPVDSLLYKCGYGNIFLRVCFKKINLFTDVFILFVLNRNQSENNQCTKSCC